MSESEIRDIFQSLALQPPGRRALAAGECLFRAGARVKDVYAITAGRLKLVRTSLAGSEVTLHRAGEGETFAEPSLFSERYHCDAVAEIATEVLVYSKADIIKAISDDPDRMMRLLRHLAVQVQAMRARAEILSLHAATDRVMCYLNLHLPSGADAMTLDLPWKQVAAEIGLTHEALYRALARLERDGAIRRNGHTVGLLKR
ncbi:MAG: Crp/FNR family transcriptional regulator [Betaproteobacteria bacterium]|nr:Crp/FNR family transcriptional regulator [Betaproteobacteria bacterium]